MSIARHIAGALLAGALLVSAAPAAARSSCPVLPVSVTRSTEDPVVFQDAARLGIRSTKAVRDLRVELRKGSRVVATAKTPKPGDVALGFRRPLTGGAYTVVVSGKRSGCHGRSTARARWHFDDASLPVIVNRPSAFADDYDSTMRVVLRSVGGVRISALTVELLTDTGVRLGQATQPGEFASTVVLDVPFTGKLIAGDYRLRLTGKAEGRPMTRDEDFSLGLRHAPATPGGAPQPPPVAPTAGMRVQHVTVDWSDGAWHGSDTAGFEVPGLGTGEIVCRPDAGWLRFFSSAPGREISMMNWVQKDWVTGSEQAVREAVLTSQTGQQFNEGFNKFGPPEKVGSGTFEGIISDRGPWDGPGGPGVEPTSVRLSWSWDYRVEDRGSCHVDATFVTAAPADEHPLARSIQIAWRGDANAAGRDGASAVLPGFGRIDATCGAGVDGVRWVTITGPEGATVTQREGSDVTVTSFPSGPVAVPLPNNAQLSFAFPGGATMVMSSRHKVNDPNTANNFCFIAAQAIAP